MRRIASLFLSGPDIFFPDARAHAERRRALCVDAGFIGLSAADGVTVETEPSEAMARELYADNISRLRQADAVVANLTPWRGVGCDPGTAFEVGFAAALGKPVFAYMNVTDEDDAELRTRVEAIMGAEQDAHGRWRDSFGAGIEDFALPESLMLWAEARRFFVVVTQDPFHDLTGLELTLDAVRAYAAD
jgi:nucleoside 2-deoxyribosyltransferase